MNKRPAFRVAADGVQRGAGQGRDRVERAVAPQLDPDFIADSRLLRGLQPAGDHQRRQGLHAFALFHRRLAKGETIAVQMSYKARGGDFASRIDNAADGALRANLGPDTPAGINRLKRLFIQNRAGLRLVEIPPGKAVDRRHNGRIRPQQGHQVIDDHGDGVRFDG